MSYTVRDLIQKLVEFDMDEEVSIGLGPSGIPNGSSPIHSVSLHHSGNVGTFGVFLVPFHHLIDADKVTK